MWYFQLMMTSNSEQTHKRTCVCGLFDSVLRHFKRTFFWISICHQNSIDSSVCNNNNNSNQWHRNCNGNCNRAPSPPWTPPTRDKHDKIELPKLMHTIRNTSNQTWSGNTTNRMNRCVNLNCETPLFFSIIVQYTRIKWIHFIIDIFIKYTDKILGKQTRTVRARYRFTSHTFIHCTHLMCSLLFVFIFFLSFSSSVFFFFWMWDKKYFSKWMWIICFPFL